MSKSDFHENAWLALVYNATAFANVADNASTSPITTISVALHTADPTDSGSQTSSESAYTGYSRVTVARSSAGWTVTGNQVQNTATVTFPQCTGGSETITHFSTGITGTDNILHSGALATSLAVSNLVSPFISAAGMTITED